MDYFGIGVGDMAATIRKLEKLRIQNHWSLVHHKFLKRLEVMNDALTLDNVHIGIGQNVCSCSVRRSHNRLGSADQIC